MWGRRGTSIATRSNDTARSWNEPDSRSTKLPAAFLVSRRSSRSGTSPNRPDRIYRPIRTCRPNRPCWLATGTYRSVLVRLGPQVQAVLPPPRPRPRGLTPASRLRCSVPETHVHHRWWGRAPVVRKPVAQRRAGCTDHLSWRSRATVGGVSRFRQRAAPAADCFDVGVDEGSDRVVVGCDCIALLPCLASRFDRYGWSESGARIVPQLR